MEIILLSCFLCSGESVSDTDTVTGGVGQFRDLSPHDDTHSSIIGCFAYWALHGHDAVTLQPTSDLLKVYYPKCLELGCFRSTTRSAAGMAMET
jgi:hypothetical protein